MLTGHGDYHPAFGRSFSAAVDLKMDSPSSMLAGEAFLERVFNAYRSATSETGTNVWNTALLIGWDEPGGTYDHVPSGPVPPPDPAAPAGEFGFTFNRSGYRVPAIMVSPWVEPGSVYNEEYRHTSLIATLRKTWGLGEAFTGRDASARGDRPGTEQPGQGPGTRLHRYGPTDGPDRWGCRSRPNSATRKQPCRPAASSASSGTSPATSSRSLPETRKNSDEPGPEDSCV